MAAPLERYYAGFSSLSGGMDGGSAASLIGPDQCAAACNVTFRGDYPTTRPPYINHRLTFAPGVQARWIGKYQGSMHYDGESGQSGFVVARGGNFFFVTDTNWFVSEITPRLPISTTADFTVPAPAASVTVSVNSESAFVVGDTVIIDSGHYTVDALFTNQVKLTYVAGAANAVALSGSAVNDATGAQLIEYEGYPPDYDFVFMFQAEQYGIILGGQNPTIIFDGSSCRLSGPQEVPAGYLGAYGWGRIWITRPDRRTFLAGDIVFGPSGTAQNGFRDAILKFTENDFLNEGGDFGVPHNSGPITAMVFLATQDTSLGIGVLLIGTTNMVFSVNAPVDRTTWKNLTYPIQTVSLIDYGPQSPRGTISINGDMFYRSLDGFRSFIVARRLFGQAGNTPMSHEIDPVLVLDTTDLLFYGSSVLFDNRFLSTISPVRTSRGIHHRGLASINFDLVSDLRTKQAPAWEGIFTGIDILQILKCQIDDIERCFIWANGETVNDIELWELEEYPQYADTADVLVNGVPTLIRNPIQAFLETRSEDYGIPFNLKNLYMAEIYLDDIVSTVFMTIKYRPDQYPSWLVWKSFSICANVCQTLPPGCEVWKPNARLYAARITLPQPPESCNTLSVQPAREAHEFQFRLEWSGHCRIRRFFTHAKYVTQTSEGSCPGTFTCKTFQDCGTSWFTYRVVPHAILAGNPNIDSPILGPDGGYIFAGS